MNSFYAYTFLSGMFIGGYTNFFSKIVITGLVLYMVNPENFTIEKFNPLYKTIFENSYPYISKVYKFNTNRVEILDDVNRINQENNKLPKLVIKK